MDPQAVQSAINNAVEAALQHHVAMQQQQPQNVRAPYEPKVPKPEPYKGEKNKADAWLFSFDLWCEQMHIPEANKLQYARAYMQREALDWLMNQDREGLINVQTPWIVFKDELKKQFQPVSLNAQAMEKLANIRQGSASVDRYVSVFRHYLNNTALAEDVKVMFFKQGLKPELRVLVELARPATLNDCIANAVNTEFALSTSGTGQRRQINDHRDRWRTNNSYTTQRTTQQATTAAQSVPMELDATELQADATELQADEYGHFYVGSPEVNRMSSSGSQRRPPPTFPGLSTAERDRRMKDRLCIKCGKANHRFRECRSEFNPGTEQGKQ
jgi:Ty3 transposon capsid-like protein